MKDMVSSGGVRKYRSIFSPRSSRERDLNFQNYWAYTQKHDGQILEEERDLTSKRSTLGIFQKKRVLSRRPLADPSLFYRNYISMQDDPKTLDPKTLLLTCIYKFARHEWSGISAAWTVTPSFSQSHSTTDKISRFHLCEEFCHVRLFHEMFRTFRLDEVEWKPMSRVTQWFYRMFSRFPEKMMAGPAFLTELMGMSFYRQIDRLFDTLLVDEPEAKERLRALLHEIMIDELAHIGQRRNFVGGFGIRIARWMYKPLVKMFFRDIPEAKYLLDVDEMVRDGLSFDYNDVAQELIDRSWIPSYCQA
jgi:hypothetical protein